jgi:hypothetical protein
MEALFCLWRVTKDPLLLARAHDILEQTRRHAPAEHRAAMLERVPLYRDIMAAWAARGK